MDIVSLESYKMTIFSKLQEKLPENMLLGDIQLRWAE